LRQSPSHRVGNAVKAPGCGDSDIGRRRVVLVLAAGGDVAHRGRIERSRPRVMIVTLERLRSITVIVTLARAATESPTRGDTDDLQNGVRQDSVPEET
jgi:hypothetical protein